MARKSLAIAAVLLVTIGAVAVAHSQVASPPQQNPPYRAAKVTSTKIHIEPVRGNVYMLAGAGGNRGTVRRGGGHRVRADRRAAGGPWGTVRRRGGHRALAHRADTVQRRRDGAFPRRSVPVGLELPA